jgi:hypothetical protein
MKILKIIKIGWNPPKMIWHSRYLFFTNYYSVFSMELHDSFEVKEIYRTEERVSLEYINNDEELYLRNREAIINISHEGKVINKIDPKHRINQVKYIKCPIIVTRNKSYTENWEMRIFIDKEWNSIVYPISEPFEVIGLKGDSFILYYSASGIIECGSYKMGQQLWQTSPFKPSYPTPIPVFMAKYYW